MTTQTNLDLIWALNAGLGIEDPGDTKYTDGWEIEIPTHEHFNFVLQNATKNLLALAEKGAFDYQAEIAYIAGAKVIVSGVLYQCKTAITGTSPADDLTGQYWAKGTAYGTALANLLLEHGVLIKDVSPRVSATTWDGNEITLSNKNSIVQLLTDNIATKNWLLANVSGEMVVVDVGTTVGPDGRSIALAESNTHRLFHEGHAPTQSEVSGTIPDAPADTKSYARVDNAWVAVTTTSVSDEPPPPVLGNGAGWYNLVDGQFYIDINDGSSSQWVPGNPPLIPTVPYLSPDEGIASVAGTQGHAGTDRVANIVSCTQVEYDAIASPVSDTFYIIVG